MKKRDFKIATDSWYEVVSGLTSEFFGIERGTTKITHLPTGRIIWVMRTTKQCRQAIEALEAAIMPTHFSSKNKNDISENKEEIREICLEIEGR